VTAKRSLPKLEGMRVVITSLIAVIIIALVSFLPAFAQERGTITITMTGVSEISITLDKTEWALGNVTPNTEYKTSPPVEWCTLTVQGNCKVNTYIEGEDATWIANPSEYRWTLSNDGSNGEHIYGLWFRISRDAMRGPRGDGYVPINKTQSEFWPYAGGSPLAPNATKKFGLALLTPTRFYSGRQMQTRIIISAVAA